MTKTAVKMPERLQIWPLDSLLPYARNARLHSPEQIEQIAASIREFGFTNPILVDSESGIVAGHGRLAAARHVGLAEVPVIVLDHLTDAQRRAYIIADNKLALNAGWDEELLAQELRALEADGFDLEMTGFDAEELADLLAEPIEVVEGLTDPDAAPDVPAEPVTRLGDIWLLGRHRLLCGSCLEVDQMARLTMGKRAHMVFTDPPYLMNFTGAIDGAGDTRNTHEPILNDNLGRAEGDQFLRDVASSIAQWCDGAWYVCFYRLGIDRLMNAMAAAGLRWRNLLIWKKDILNLSNSDYKSIYEPIIYGWCSDYEPVLYGWNHRHEFRGAKGAVDVLQIRVPSVWEIDRTKKNDLHPTMKPVALCEAAIMNSSKTGQVVLDLFGGSGSTLIAAEKTGRTAWLCELEPRYCDVIVKRWEEYTGKQAKLERVEVAA